LLSSRWRSSSSIFSGIARFAPFTPIGKLAVGFRS
jgi:hypothetical protein